MIGARGRYTPKMQAILERTGVLPPDTEFNRRAKKYADHAERCARARENQLIREKNNAKDERDAEDAKVGEAGAGVVARE